MSDKTTESRRREPAARFSALCGDCDRCGAPVQAHEDATRLEEVAFALETGAEAAFCGFTRPRHVACSPSRWQFLGGPQQASWTPALQALYERAARVLLQACAEGPPAPDFDYTDAVRDAVQDAVRAAAALPED